MIDLHRHDKFSSFDGYGKATDLAKIAKDKGLTSLGLSNHGNTNGLVQHYVACKEVGIKPVLGVEGYFLPKYKPQNRGYHLCLFAKNAKGYGNINRIQFEGEKQKYYNPIWDFSILEKYHEGVICSSACVAGFVSQMVVKGKLDVARKFIKKMVSIFGDDFYIEIQPYTLSEERLQENINVELIKLAKELKVKCILTSDSHRGLKEDFDTYLKMHEMANHDVEHIRQTYKERYMPTEKEIKDRFVKMHTSDFGKEKAIKLANKMVENLEEIEDKVDEDIFADFQQLLPKLGDDSYKKLVKKVQKSLKEKGKYTEKYIARAKEELDVIKTLGFQDYFLIVADYVNWAKQQGITVGPGRGSACNCLIAYCLGITEVDSVLFGLDFRRFLRKDKKKMPDIDMDFETSRRGEVIKYIIDRYPNQTARICSYGLYKVDNLINDLAKVCGLPTDIKNENAATNKKIIASLKRHIKEFIEEDNLDTQRFLLSKKTNMFNMKYDNICKHFAKLYFQVRFIGTHAAGVAVTGGNILDYTSLRIDKQGDLYTSYDLNDLETLHVIKFDMLGLKTMEEIGELRRATNTPGFNEEWVKDEKILKNFNSGNTVGVFQFDKGTVRDLLQKIECDNFRDIAAASAMNRPGPISMGQPDLYAQNKFNLDEAKKSILYKYTKDSYGTLIYQEQIQKICVKLGNMTWGDADKVMKMIGGQSQSDDARAEFERNKKELGEKFVKGAMENGLSKEEAEHIFSMVLVYSFNKGHSVGYSLISVEEMYYKTYFPIQFWASKLKAENDDKKRAEYKSQAIKDGCVLLLPHVNGSVYDEISELKGEEVIQEGLSMIKGVGEKAANAIIESGPYIDFPDFEEKWEEMPKEKKRSVTKRTITLLKDFGAFDFNEKRYLKRVVSYNSSLYGREFSKY